MELEIKHLAPYLPYELQLQYVVRDKVEKTGLMTYIGHFPWEIHPTRVSIELSNQEHIWMFKPILRPLSDLYDLHEGVSYISYLWNKIISTDGDSFDKDEFYENCQLGLTKFLPIMVYEQLFKWHFDVFGLISNGLAVDINTITK